MLYRINVIELEIPPLRDRIEDIRPLSISILEKINRKHQKAFTQVKYEKLPHSSDNFFASKDDFEKSTIIEALERYDGNKSKTAKHLGISRSLLYSKLSKYDIK